MSTSASTRQPEAVIRDAASTPFWEAAAEGLLKIRRCGSCSRAHYYPRALCPYCQADTHWETVSGLGTIYSVSLTRRGGPVPYAIAYVRLDEGVTMLTNIVHCDLESVRIDDRVRVCFVQAQDGSLVPMFEPLPSSGTEAA